MSDNVIKIKLIKPHQKQSEILQAYNQYRFIVVKAGRRFGKSVITHQLAITECLKKPDFRCVIITPTFSLGKKFYNDILNIVPQQFLNNPNKSELLIPFQNGSTIQFFSGESLINLRGTKNHLIIVDESAYSIVEDDWNNILRPTLTDYKGKAIFISTPNGKNFFISLYLRAKFDTNYKSFHFTSYDNPHIDPDEINTAKNELPSVEFEQEYLAQETSSKSNPFKNNIEKNISEISNEPTVCFGIDIAKSFDYTVIYGISITGKCTYLKKAQSHTYTIIQRIIKEVRNEHPNVPMFLDVTGCGSSVYDNLVFDEQGEVVIENIHKFLFTQKSKIKIFQQLIKDVEDGNIEYPQDVADEMSTIQMTYSQNGYPRFEAQQGFHDDICCALAISNSFRKSIDFYSSWDVESI